MKKIIKKENESGDIAVIQFESKNTLDKAIFEGELYFNLKNYNLIKMKGYIKSLLGLNFKNKEFRLLNAIYHYDITFQNSVGDYSLINNIEVVLNFDLVNKDNVSSKIMVKSNLTSYNLNDKFTSNTTKKVKDNYNLISQINKKHYDAEFWENNSVIKRSAEDKLVIDSFNKQSLFIINPESN
ncbi:hypothetical protein [Formosa haliotis]|uniref:hypothetical protein n=1 Tax=Formosa haliotis TaxID=1555194 RepID=UPI0008268477|nr:hypothetical protein [Formosa haliotis]